MIATNAMPDNIHHIGNLWFLAVEALVERATIDDGSVYLSADEELIVVPRDTRPPRGARFVGAWNCDTSPPRLAARLARLARTS